MEITNATVSRHVGKYNMLNSAEESAFIAVRFVVDGMMYVISDNVEPHSEHDYDGDDISDAVDHIGNSIDRYWISTGRDELKKKIAFFWANEQVIRRSYAASQASKYQRLAANNAKQAMRFLDEATREIEELPASEAA